MTGACGNHGYDAEIHLQSIKTVNIGYKVQTDTKIFAREAVAPDALASCLLLNPLQATSLLQLLGISDLEEWLFKQDLQLGDVD
jgi:hypothetical protein